MHVLVLSCLKFYMKAQKHACFHAFSASFSSIVPPFTPHYIINGKGSIAATLVMAAPTHGMVHGTLDFLGWGCVYMDGASSLVPRLH